MVDIKILLTSIIGIIVLIIVTFSLIGNSAPTLKQAALDISSMNNCSEYTACLYPATGTYHLKTAGDINCSNASNGDAGCAVGYYDLPLRSIFSPTGVILVILMAAVLIFLIVVSLKGVKQK